MPAASAICEEEKRSRPKRGAAPFCLNLSVAARQLPLGRGAKGTEKRGCCRRGELVRKTQADETGGRPMAAPTALIKCGGEQSSQVLRLGRGAKGTGKQCRFRQKRRISTSSAQCAHWAPSPQGEGYGRGRQRFFKSINFSESHAGTGGCAPPWAGPSPGQGGPAPR